MPQYIEECGRIVANKSECRSSSGTLRAVMAVVASAVTFGFDTAHARNYFRKFLSHLSGTAEKNATYDGSQFIDVRRGHHLTSTGHNSSIRSLDGIVKVDPNTIEDLVQEAYLLYHISQRGKNGQVAEKLDTSRACFRVLRLHQKEQKRIGLLYKMAKQQRREYYVMSDIVEILTPKQSEKKQLCIIVDMLSRGYTQQETADACEVSQQYIGKVIKSIRQAAQLRKEREEQEAATQMQESIPLAPVNPQTGQYLVNVPLSDEVHCTIGSNYDVAMRHDDTFWFVGDLPNKPTTIAGPSATSGSVDTIVPVETTVPQTTPVDPVRLASRYFYVGCASFRPLVYSDGTVSNVQQWNAAQWDGLPDNEGGTGI